MRKTRIWVWQAGRWLAVLLICCLTAQSIAAYGGQTMDREREGALYEAEVISENDAEDTIDSTDSAVTDATENTRQNTAPDTGQHTGFSVSGDEAAGVHEDAGETQADESLTAENGVTKYEISVSDNTAHPVRILFIGNSFTKRKNDDTGLSVAMQLSDIAEQAGKNVQITTLIHGGARLQVFSGSTGKRLADYQSLRRLLEKQDWDYVVLQESSVTSAFAADTDMLQGVLSLKTLITDLQPNAKLLLYMTHGYTYTDEKGTTYVAQKMQQLTAAGYHEVSKLTGIEVVPAGMQQMRAQELFPEVRWLLSDNKHPSRQTYFAVAATFYQRLFGQLPEIDANKLHYARLTQEQVDAIVALQADGIRTKETSLVLQPGDRQTMQVFSEGKEPVDGATYFSTDPQVVSVGKSSGMMKVAGYGKAVVIAQAPNGCQAYCLVSVPKPLQFSRDSYVVGAGDKLQIMPEGDSKDLIWKSSRTKVATVDQNGQIVAVGAGRTQITVTNRKDKKDRASFWLYVSCGAVQQLNSAPAKVQPSDNRKGALTLSWKKVQGAARYVIYRSPRQNGKYRRIGVTRKLRYTDSNIRTNRVYYYKVQPVSKKKKMYNGPLSAPVEGVVLSVRKLKGSRVGRKGCRLTWKNSNLADGYEIYRAERKKGKLEKVADVRAGKNMQYTDLAADKRQCTYKIVPYRKEGRVKYYGREATVLIK